MSFLNVLWAPNMHHCRDTVTTFVILSGVLASGRCYMSGVLASLIWERIPIRGKCCFMSAAANHQLFGSMVQNMSYSTSKDFLPKQNQDLWNIFFNKIIFLEFEVEARVYCSKSHALPCCWEGVTAWAAGLLGTTRGQGCRDLSKLYPSCHWPLSLGSDKLLSTVWQICQMTA